MARRSSFDSNLNGSVCGGDQATDRLNETSRHMTTRPDASPRINLNKISDAEQMELMNNTEKINSYSFVKS